MASRVPVSRQTPSRFGPRHCGQSSARVSRAAGNSTANAATRRRRGANTGHVLSDRGAPARPRSNRRRLSSPGLPRTTPSRVTKTGGSNGYWRSCPLASAAAPPPPDPLPHAARGEGELTATRLRVTASPLLVDRVPPPPAQRGGGGQGVGGQQPVGGERGIVNGR